MTTADLYRLAGVSSWVALVAFVLSGIALALFFGGAGQFWGPVNDALIVVTVLALIPAVVAVARLTGNRAAPFLAVLTVATVAGLVLVAVGQTLLIVGRLSLEGSYVTGGIGIVPFLAWLVLVAILGLGDSPLPDAIGRLAAVAIATIVVAIADRGRLAGAGPVDRELRDARRARAWMASLATTFGERATTA